MSIADEARAKLEGITPGPWVVNTEGWAFISSGGDSVLHAYVDTKCLECDAEVCQSMDCHVAASGEDAEFIAAAPDLVRGLLAELDQAREFIQDIATHGVHADLNPTRRWDGDQQSEYLWWGMYIGEADKALRTRARRILSGES
ncbi:hypothetical protein SEA_ODAY_87 [Gordonia phage ODay]|nr:hypothetical protein SEA_ODAY_87 [Gordonia phage ODay]